MITIYYLLHMVVLAAFPQREARKIEIWAGFQNIGGFPRAAVVSGFLLWSVLLFSSSWNKIRRHYYHHRHHR